MIISTLKGSYVAITDKIKAWCCWLLSEDMRRKTPPLRLSLRFSTPLGVLVFAPTRVALEYIMVSHDHPAMT